MANYTLSPRMQVIANMASGSKRAADIGCDHGKIAVDLAKSGAKVFAVDISEPSLQKARELAKLEKIEENIDFFCDDGLESVKHISFDTIIIAGMGWRMIASILEKNVECAKVADKLILQPMDSVVEMRNYLCDSGYNIIDEKLVVDDGRMYTVICAKYEKGKKLNLEQMIIGPKVLENNDILIPELAKRELIKRDKKYAGLLMANKRDNKLIKKIRKEMKILKGKIKE